jgi:hypothetical protein
VAVSNDPSLGKILTICDPVDAPKSITCPEVSSCHSRWPQSGRCSEGESWMLTVWNCRQSSCVNDWKRARATSRRASLVTHASEAVRKPDRPRPRS